MPNSVGQNYVTFIAIRSGGLVAVRTFGLISCSDLFKVLASIKRNVLSYSPVKKRTKHLARPGLGSALASLHRSMLIDF